MTQQGLDFGHGDGLSRAYRKVLRAVDDAVDAITLATAAAACDCRSSDLAKVLAGEENRYLRVEWIMAIGAVAPVFHRTRICEEFAAWLGFAVLPARPPTPEEKLARLERLCIERMGAAGAELVREVNR